MADKSFLDWPFFEPRHKAWAETLDEWAAGAVQALDHSDTDAACRTLVKALGADGWLKPTAAGTGEVFDVRTLCLARETLARHDGLADFAFAMQGLGTGAISLFGTEAQRSDWLPLTRTGKAIAGFALTEPQSGSDVANSTMTATEDGEYFVLNGEKTWISNGGIADVYTVFARTGERPGAKGLSAFVVPADTVGVKIVERLETIAPHPLARLRFSDCRIPKSALIGARGEGFKIAMNTLDVGRLSLGAQCLGTAKELLRLSVKHANEREQFGKPIGKLQAIQWMLSEMAVDVYAMESMLYRTTQTCDNGENIARESAIVKLFCSEALGRIADKAVQLHGGMGYMREYPIERMYRDARITRIFEGTNEIQKLVIARDLLKKS